MSKEVVDSTSSLILSHRVRTLTWMWPNHWPSTLISFRKLVPICQAPWYWGGCWIELNGWTQFRVAICDLPTCFPLPTLCRAPLHRKIIRPTLSPFFHFLYQSIGKLNPSPPREGLQSLASSRVGPNQHSYLLPRAQERCVTFKSFHLETFLFPAHVLIVSFGNILFSLSSMLAPEKITL